MCRNAVSQNLVLERSTSVNADAIPAPFTAVSDPEFDAMFAAQYSRIARVLARVVRDPGRAEELAVDVFLKWWRRAGARGDGAAGWLYRSAVRLGIDELRRDARRGKYERLIGRSRGSPATPEDVRSSEDERRRVRSVLARLRRRDAALLLLRADDLAYDEIGVALGLAPSSIGTLLKRAQNAFRNEYVRRYGTE